MADLQHWRCGSSSDLSSRWYWAGDLYNAAVVTAVVSANQIYAMPFISGQAGIADQIVCDVTGASGGGGTAILSIYTQASVHNLYPQRCMLAGSQIAVDATGQKGITILCSLVPGGLYWFAIHASQACTVRAVEINEMPALLGYSSGFAHMNRFLQVSYAYGMPPDPFPNSATASCSRMPMVGVRYTTLY